MSGTDAIDLDGVDSGDHPAIAAAAGLTYVVGDASGFRRIRRGKGFSYVNADGEVVGEKTRAHIESMAIPPAWNDVWISRDEDAHLQVVGYDEAGRKQYIYHPRWEAARDQVKFDRLGSFARGLLDFRKRVDHDLRRGGLDREKVVALAASVLDRTLIRVGNRRYAEENETYGLTTLTNGHVEVANDRVRFDFSAKGGAQRQSAVEDRRLARLISQCRDIPGETLFTYPIDDSIRSVSSSDVNDYVSGIIGEGVTAKDFRVWGATTTVARLLASRGTNGDTDSGAPLLEAIDAAAERIGNTRAVCRTSYVHPTVVDAFEDGALTTAWKRSRTGRWLDRAESTVRYLLTEGS